MMWRNEKGERFPNWIHIKGVHVTGPQGTGVPFTYVSVTFHHDEWLPQTPLACRLFRRTMSRVDPAWIWQ